ncbi:MAG TPA: GTP 3',8-cyclase MoaA, partial [Methylophilaceae bacterium]|nr:GTP 3',8-cyclase MoaA [Methylophilaceae bacterium]
MTTNLIDQFNRTINYIRISVTDRCDFRCIYCMAEKMTFLPRDEVLTLEEICRLANIFSTMGVTKVRITGGEPLVRKNIDSLFQNLSKNKNIKELTLTTNGSQLIHKAAMLKESGVKRINISLDSLNPTTFKKMTRTGNLNDVMNGINHALDVGFEKIKLNIVLMRDINDSEIFDLTNYAIDHGLDISFIEEMPLGLTDYERKITSISNDEVIKNLNTRFSLEKINYKTGGPAKYWSIQNTQTKIGLISPHSHN